MKEEMLTNEQSWILLIQHQLDDIRRQVRISWTIRIINLTVAIIAFFLLFLSINGVFYNVQDIKNGLWPQTPQNLTQRNDAKSAEEYSSELPNISKQKKQMPMDSQLGVSNV